MPRTSSPASTSSRQLYGFTAMCAPRSRTGRSSWSRRLSSPALAVLLLVIGFVGIYIELHTPGMGVGGFVAALAFLLFFWSNFLHGTAGLARSAVVSGRNVLPAAGGFGHSRLRHFWIGRRRDDSGVARAGEPDVCAATDRIAIGRAAALAHDRGGRDGDCGGGIDRAAPLFAEGAGVSHAAAWRRRRKKTWWIWTIASRWPISRIWWASAASATTNLMPAGKADFNGELVDVIAEGMPIDRGSPVVVVKARGNRVIVRAADA